jgi:hypothetical protein
MDSSRIKKRGWKEKISLQTGIKSVYDQVEKAEW